ncbi:MAG: HAMP domain-containing histidine kinase [Ignavibacteriaceae bacterium]|nr:HAMP domain-containing histidine kinase [Ignavibacteriaceae bacterium]
MNRLVPFHTSLEQLGKTDTGKYYIKTAKSNAASLINKSKDAEYSLDFDLYKYSQKLNEVNNPESIVNLFKNEIKQLSFFYDAEIFLLSERLKELSPISSTPNQKILNYVKSKISGSLIDWVAESQKMTILPFGNSESTPNSALNCIVIPIYFNQNFRGILTAISVFSSLHEESSEYKTLKLMLDMTFAKLYQYILHNELMSSYSEMQILQSRIANNYKLAAIGELTSKAIENISSPLQVILSCADIIESDFKGGDKNITQSLITQVNEVKEILERLTYFISSPESTEKIQSCNINDSVQDFYKLIEHPLKSESYECVLDLDDTLPPVLSNPNYLKQILINAFSLTNPFKSQGGGIIIQTRYSHEIIKLKLSFTNQVNQDENNQMGLKILSSLMEKHEGDFSYVSNQNNGTILIFSFPLKRKNR